MWYIQNLETSTVANILWNVSCQAVVFHITEIGVSNIRKKEYIQNRWLQKEWSQGRGLTNTITQSTGTYQKKEFQPSCFLSVPWTTNVLVKTVFYMQKRTNCHILVNFISDIISIWLHIEMFWAFRHFDVYFRSSVLENNKYTIYKSIW